MGVSVTVFAGIVRVLTGAHGDRLLSDQGQFNELLALMGELEQRWESLAAVPALPGDFPPAARPGAGP
jgi:hypothetical protein